jgi:hypothetical protein
VGDLLILSQPKPGPSACRCSSEMETDLEPQPPLSLAAARALFRAPQAEDACWADVHMPDGTVRACGRPEATSLGLCADHRVELFGLEAS